MPPRKWSDLLPLLPPSLLFLVALGQVYLAHTADLTPWKGGGFGMFSTNDGESRRVDVWVSGPDGERKLDVPSYDRGAAALAAFPTLDRLNAFGRGVAKSQRSQGYEVARVRVVVWRPSFQLQTMERGREPIREAVVVLRGD